MIILPQADVEFELLIIMLKASDHNESVLFICEFDNWIYIYYYGEQNYCFGFEYKIDMRTDEN